jgi:hypothetical protein
MEIFMFLNNGICAKLCILNCYFICRNVIFGFIIIFGIYRFIYSLRFFLKKRENKLEKDKKNS